MTVNNEIEKYVFKPSNFQEMRNMLFAYELFVLPVNNNTYEIIKRQEAFKVLSKQEIFNNMSEFEIFRAISKRKTLDSIAETLKERDKMAHNKYINANSGLVQLLDDDQGGLADLLWNLKTFYMPDINKIVEDYKAMKKHYVEIAKNPYTPDAVKRQSANELFALAKNIADTFDYCYQSNMNEILTANEFNRQNPNNPPYPDIARALEQHPSVIADYNMRQKSMQDLQAEGKISK